jgi:V8-like Glu-specific endopeptidase
MDSMGGSSGGPVWVIQNGNRYVVGIHHTETIGGCTVGPNGAVRVNADVFEFMNDMRNDYS